MTHYRQMHIIVVTLAALALGGCGAASTAQGARPQGAGMRPAVNTHGGDLTSARRPAGNTDAIIGRNAAALTRMFGAPRLDVREGAGHKLQFTNSACVLDAYLYAPRDGAEAVVTHVDTRNPSGDDVDRASCIAALQRR
jgi:hypothetical protein